MFQRYFVGQMARLLSTSRSTLSSTFRCVDLFLCLQDTRDFNSLIEGLAEEWCCRRNGTVSHKMSKFATNY